jgi:hypothetical protein
MQCRNGRRVPPRWRAAWIGMLVFVLALPVCTRADDRSGGMRGPSVKGAPLPPLGSSLAPDYLAQTRSSSQPAAATGPLLALLEFYRTVVSPVDGNRCGMAPTCSLYSEQAFQRYGIVLGFLLTADRLLHEADEQARVPFYEQHGQRHYLDPLAVNTYWLPEWLR